ncbi:MAG: diguanylate cyclase [Cellulomonas sp.]
MLVLNLLASGYLLLLSQPSVDRYTEIARQSRLTHDAMLSEQADLRGWLAVGDPAFLATRNDDQRSAGTASAELIRQSAVDPAVTAEVVEMMRAADLWHAWADQAVAQRYSDLERSTGALSPVLIQDKTLFDAYRAAQARAADLILGDRDQALTHQRIALLALPLTFLVAAGAAGARARMRRRQLARTILEPIHRVLGAIGALRAGDLSVRASATGVVELDAVGSALDALAGDLASANELAAARETGLELLAARLAAVVRVAREVSGSLSTRYVSEAVTSAAAELLGAPTTLWVRSDEGPLRIACRSDDPHGLMPPSDLEPPSLVTTSADDARRATDIAACAYPVVLAGMVVGVLQVCGPAADEDTEQVLAALLSTGAAALESARLNGAARERADIDAITQLPNRRCMDADLLMEWERCRRYDRPVSFAMIDLDHFKQINDVYGHPVGDTALRAAAVAITAGLRASDTAYRYGGEEFAVLLRETDLEAGIGAAERLRTCIAAVTVPGSVVRVTASIGLAERRVTMTDPLSLVAAADAALYSAKRAGRNRVVATPPVPAETLAVV